MNTVANLSELERRILASLNESGDEYVTALVNSVLRCNGEDSETVKFVTALWRLFEAGLIEFADRRSETALAWEVLAHGHESAEKLNMLITQLTWEGDSGLWTWNTEAPRLAVLLTEHGVKLSHEILERFGWEMTEPI
ncbi:MAG: hypothetical protein JJU36_01175 [Phycisphaeraceae bacterium]|nr:hypothetical protein [Phycisphaeraceae bacterium]